MYKVLIVDDEEWTRISIRELIDWNKLGIYVIQEALHGKMALEMIRREQPDILITDIRMPVMDGLALLERVHTEYPRMQSIVLSGYSEFEYAKKAIVYGVLDYVLKPIDEEELENALWKAVKRLDEEESRRHEWVQMSIRLNESGPLTREKALTQLVTDTVLSEDQRREIFRRVNGGLWDEEMCVLVFKSANFREIAASRYDNDENLTSFVFMNVLEELLQPLGEGVLFRKFGQQNEFVWLRKVEWQAEGVSHTNFYRELKMALEKIKQSLGFEVYAGVGGEFDRLSDAIISYQQASEAVRNAGIIHRGMIVHADEVRNRAEYYIFPENKERERCCITWRTDTAGKRWP